MRIIVFCLLIHLLPLAAMDTCGNISLTRLDEMNNPESSIGLFDIMFIQYRGIFRDLLGRRCVYYPSCSHYAQKAIGIRGPVVGVMMALERWTRCSPAAYSYGDYLMTGNHELVDPVEPGKEITCWGHFLLPF